MKKEEKRLLEQEVNMSNFNKRSPKVFLQTLKAKLISECKKKTVHLLLDLASHKSYILKSFAQDMKYTPLRQEKLIHSLFGGISTKETIHDCYKIRLRNLIEQFEWNFEVMDQTKICEDVRHVCQGSWIKELQEKYIILTDISEKNEDIAILIGADIMGKLLTSKNRYYLQVL